MYNQQALPYIALQSCLHNIKKLYSLKDLRYVVQFCTHTSFAVSTNIPIVNHITGLIFDDILHNSTTS